MAMEEVFSLELNGGSPWGFTLQGGLDHRSPLRIGRVTAGGRAATAGLVAGDYILTINGQITKELKHLQAQQLIKKSKMSIQLTCTKMRPGIMSPAVIMSKPPATFAFPNAFGSKATPNRTKAISVSKPLPPPIISNGHTRGGSLDTPSESTTTISTPSPVSSPCNVEVYDVKFVGIRDSSSDQTTPLPASIMSQPPVQSSRDDKADAAEEEEPQPSFPAGPTDDQPSFPAGPTDDQPSFPADHQSDGPTDDQPSFPADHQSDGPVSTDSGVIQDVEEKLSEELESVSGLVKDIQQQVESLNESAPDPEEVGETLAMSGGSTEGAEESIVIDEPKPETRRRSSQRNSFTKRELADVVSQAAQARARRDSSSAEMTSSTSSAEGAVSKPTPPTEEITTPSAIITAPAHEKPMIKPGLTKRDGHTPLLTKDPGWYQQMFQSFSNTVQDTFPLAKKDDAYDARGLKIRSGSVGVAEEEANEIRKEMESPETPVYVYDERGLRVPRGRAGSHVRSGSTPAVMEGVATRQHGAKFVSVSSGGSYKDEILASSKKSTSYKTAMYSTGNSRNYWKEKDQSHIEFDAQRRCSQEQIFHSRDSSADHSVKMTSMHPLLQPELEEDSGDKGGEDAETHKVFERIDASKLQGALKNASVLTALENEGVPSHLLPALAQQQHEAADAAKEEKKKAPPGAKALGSFNFQGKNAKELSFKKGDLITLNHTVDDNWLEGEISGMVGIFPKNYVKVLTRSEFEALNTSKPPMPVMQAKVLFDFQGETQRELELKKDDVVIIDKQVDANWYSGHLGDKKGIFPLAYVEVIQQ